MYILWVSLVAQMVKPWSTMRETRVRSLCWEDPLEKEMAAHSSILAWKIPRTTEPGRLPSMGSQRVGHNWVTSFSLFTSKKITNIPNLFVFSSSRVVILILYIHVCINDIEYALHIFKLCTMIWYCSQLSGELDFVFFFLTLILLLLFKDFCYKFIYRHV